MYKSRFIQLLASLSKEELKRFDDFLHSPFFNKKQQPIELFQWLFKRYERWYPLYISTAKSKQEAKRIERKLAKYLAKERIYAKLFPDQTYNDARIRRIMSDCKQLLESFLLQLSFERHEETPVRQLLRLKHHQTRDENQLFEHELEQAWKQQEAVDYRDQEFFYMAFRLEQLANDHNIRKGKTQYSYQDLSDYFDNYFLIYKLRMFCTMQNIKKKFNIEFRFGMIDEICAYVESHESEYSPLVKIYYYLLRMGRGIASTTDYPELVQLLNQYKQTIPANERRQIYGFMLNYLVIESRKPNQNRYRETFVLLKVMIEEGAIYFNDQLTISYFDFCVRIAIKVHEYDWAEDFIYQHEDRLAGGTDMQEVFDYNLLNILFFKQEYQAILKRIDDLKFTTERYQILRRILKLKTLYEFNLANDFFLLTDSLKKFIKSKKNLGESAFKHYINFASFTEKLGKSKFDQRKLPEYFKSELQTALIAEKEWVMDKVEELQNPKEASL